MADSYRPENHSAKEKLDDLKQRVWNSHLKTQNVVVHMDYPNPLEGARLMFESIKNHLEKNLLVERIEMSRRQKDLAPHNGFMLSHTTLYARWEAEAKELSDVLEAGQNVVVMGPAGCGKSAILCNWLQHEVMGKPKVVVVPFFIGCAPNTRDPEEILSFIFGELEHHANDIDDLKIHKNSSDHVQNAPKLLESSELDQSDDFSPPAIQNKMNEKIFDERSQKKKAYKRHGEVKNEEENEKTASEKSSLKMDSSNTAGTTYSGGDNSSMSGKADSSSPSAKEVKRPEGKELMVQILSKLEQLVQQGRRVVLAFDGLHRLVPASKTSKHLYWLPDRLPQGVTCVVTTNEADTVSVEILVTLRRFHALRVPSLTEDMKKSICVQTLKQCGKELSNAQLTRIISTEQTSNPLFLKILLAELSIYGYFKSLDNKIDALTSHKTIKALLQSFLERLEADYNVKEYGGNLVGEILLALLVVYEGLSENEIMGLFNIQSHVWSPLFFAMEYFLISNLGLLGFAFAEIKEAVEEKYMQNEETKIRIKGLIIQYFDKKRMKLKPWFTHKQLSERQNMHAMHELVWLQKSMGKKNDLISTLTDLSVLHILNHDYELYLLELWQWTEMKWRDVCNLYLRAFDQSIVDLYLGTASGAYDTETSPGVKMRKSLAHMRHLFGLANYHEGVERVLKREISLLENAKDKMDEEKRKEVLRDSCYNLACCFASQDRYDKAWALHQSNMLEFEKAYAEAPTVELRRLIAFNQNGLGIICINTKQFDEAIKHFKDSSVYHREQKDRKNEASCYTNLGLVYMYKNNLDKALQYDKMALEAYEEAYFGHLPLDVGNLLTNMGIIYRRKHDLVQAEEMYQKSLQIKANAVGWDHPLLATAYMNLGTVEMHRSNYSKAEYWARKAIAIYEMNEFEKDRKEYRRCRENLFVHLLNQGKHEEALPLFLDIFDILNKNGWLEECLAQFHRQMVAYMIEKEMYEKAEMVTAALMASPKGHPDNYIQLDMIDRCRIKRGQAVAVRPYTQTLDYAMEKYITHKALGNLVCAKLSLDILPNNDKLKMQKLLKYIAFSKSWQDPAVMDGVVATAETEGKGSMLVDVLVEMACENQMDKEIMLMALRVCVKMSCLTKAFPLTECLCGENPVEMSKIFRPVRSQLDCGLLLVAQGRVSDATAFLESVCTTSDIILSQEAQIALAKLKTDGKSKENLTSNLKEQKSYR